MFFESKSIVLVALRSEGNNLKEMLNIKKKNNRYHWNWDLAVTVKKKQWHSNSTSSGARVLLNLWELYIHLTTSNNDPLQKFLWTKL